MHRVQMLSIDASAQYMPIIQRSRIWDPSTDCHALERYMYVSKPGKNTPTYRQSLV